MLGLSCCVRILRIKNHGTLFPCFHACPVSPESFRDGAGFLDCMSIIIPKSCYSALFWMRSPRPMPRAKSRTELALVRGWLYFIRTPIFRQGAYPLYTILPLVRSYGLISRRTRSPGRMRMRCMRNFPAKCPKISWPLSNFTLNLAPGNNSSTTPFTVIKSFGDGVIDTGCG